MIENLSKVAKLNNGRDTNSVMREIDLLSSKSLSEESNLLGSYYKLREDEPQQFSDLDLLKSFQVLATLLEETTTLNMAPRLK